MVMKQYYQHAPELWRLEYLREYYAQPDPIRCIRWFESELCATKYKDEVANGRGEVISLDKYVLAYVLAEEKKL